MLKLKKYNYYKAIANATIALETYATEKMSEKDLRQKINTLKAVAKALDLYFYVNEVIVEEDDVFGEKKK
jgi:hypothetical protein